jgi:hypothetical protein
LVMLVYRPINRSRWEMQWDSAVPPMTHYA